MPQDKLDVLLPDWPAPYRVKACTTTRPGGYSEGVWASLNLADHVDDDPIVVGRNRALVKQALSLPSEPAWLRQVHGCDVCMADEPGQSGGFDASIATKPGTVCAVLTADCLPLLLCTRDGACVAAVHAGWRGLASGVIEQTVSSMYYPPDQIMAWMGPAIGPNAFEVGEDVRQVFLAQDQEAAAAFSAHADKWLCDIYHLARIRLVRLGMTEIFGGGLCTYRDKDRFFSYRRDGVTGRMASLIWLTG